ncbi:acetyl-CoA C-acyltransferase [Actinomadura sp. LD22]|uniref:Acetyl-CoA C-acyltransferase n=1 Tax=Actinomadura physcomitrii TaxID=2650748 RepID=A0A6I4ML24_9ACTN|nr:thiolase family protein [Actinomadura physcomitrii]MWA04854.1 acetyl-CoA C-acyltransferase [Actinomadura physcomitrii]
MTEAVIVEAVRTATGKRHGSLSGWHPADLLAATLTELVKRTGIDPALVDDVIAGCVNQVGSQALNIGRSAVLAAGWPESVPATTIDRQCGSSQQSAHFAAQGVISGAYDIAIACGVENMTQIPMRAQVSDPAYGQPFGPLVDARYSDRENFGQRGRINQGLSAELIAQKWGLSRRDLDEFGARSQQRAAEATKQGLFSDEILPLRAKRIDKETRELVEDGSTLSADEGIRPGTTAEKLGNLKPSFTPEGSITAGNSSQISDGASAMLIMSRERAEQLGLRPRARFHSFALAGVDPIMMLTGPIPATEKVLKKAGLTPGDIDHFEVNEAFASVVLAWLKENPVDQAKVNPLGGAIALGHPLGASGGRLMTTMLYNLERTGGRFGLQTMCEGGGLANATILERL